MKHIQIKLPTSRARIESTYVGKYYYLKLANHFSGISFLITSVLWQVEVYLVEK